MNISRKNRFQQKYVNFQLPPCLRKYNDNLLQFTLLDDTSYIRGRINKMRVQNCFGFSFRINGSIEDGVSELFDKWHCLSRTGNDDISFLVDVKFHLSFGTFLAEEMMITKPIDVSDVPLHLSNLVNMKKDCKFYEGKIFCMGHVTQIGD